MRVSVCLRERDRRGGGGTEREREYLGSIRQWSSFLLTAVC